MANVLNGAAGIISSAAAKIKQYWRTPPKGRYMNYREIASLAGGGIGIKAVLCSVEIMILSVGNNLIGNVIGVTPTNIYILYLIAMVADFPLTGLRAWIIDNTRGRKGKYRPYLISMGIPTTILCVGFVWMPYESMTQAGKCVTVLLFNIGFRFFYNFFNEVYTNFVVVLSPNTQERADVSSIKAVADSIAPSIINFIVPLFGSMVAGRDTLNDIRIYRYVYPPIAIIGMLVGIIVYVNVREKTVRARTHENRVRFPDALRSVVKNKYFWIISLAGWLGFLEGAYGNILWWMYSYREACSAAEYSVITMIYGNASLWGMLAAPFMIKRFGKRAVLVVTNLFNILFIAALFPVLKYIPEQKVIWGVLACLWMNALFGSFAHILNPALNGDIRDYQQYVTGERIDGMFSAVGLIGAVVTMLTSGVLPRLYETGGINEETAAALGYSSPYDVLYDPGVFNNIMTILITASVIGAALNVIPYFFYDLSERRQKAMIKVFELRAALEDNAAGVLSDSELAALPALVNAKELADSEETPKSELKAKLKADRRTSGRRKAKKAYYAALELNDDIYAAKEVIKETEKYSTAPYRASLERARRVYAAGPEGVTDVSPDELDEAKALPRGTEEEKKTRALAVDEAKTRLRCANLTEKHFPNGLTEPDECALEELYKKETELEKAASEQGADRRKVKKILKEKNRVSAEIRTREKDSAMYRSCAKSWLDARRTVREADALKKLENTG